MLFYLSAVAGLLQSDIPVDRRALVGPGDLRDDGAGSRIESCTQGAIEKKLTFAKFKEIYFQTNQFQINIYLQRCSKMKGLEIS